VRIAHLLLCTLLLSLLPLNPAAAEPRSLRVGAFSYYPAIFQTDSGRIDGFYVDILTEIARREDLHITYVYGSWAEGLERLKNGEVDLLTSVARTPERETWMDFGSATLLTVWGELYVLPKSTLHEIRDVADKRIAVMKGGYNARSFMDLTKKFDIPCTFVEVADFDAVFAAIEAGEVDGGVVNSTYGSARHAQSKVVSSGIIFNPFDIYFAVKKGRNGDLLQITNRYLTDWRGEKNSPYYQALRHWGHGVNIKPAEIPTWLKSSLWLLLVLFISGGSFIVLLRREVQRATLSLQQREQNLAQSEKRYRDLFENAPVSLWEEDFSPIMDCLNDLRQQGVTDLPRHLQKHPEIIGVCAGSVIIHDVNRATLDLHQATSKEELLANLTHTFTSDSYHSFAEQLLAIWQGETSYNLEGSVKTLKGRELRVQLRWQAMPGHEQRLDRVLVSLLDITAKTDAMQGMEQALHAEAEARHQLRALLYAVPNGIVVTDDQEQIILLNPTAGALLGIGQESLGYPLKDSGADSAFLNWLQSGTLPRPQSELLTLVDRRDGQSKQIQIQAYTSAGGSETPAGTIITLRDVTREQESDRMKSAFIATAAHELRTPLASILGFAELLQSSEDPTVETAREYIGIIHDKGEALQHIIDDLLDVSRVESGHLVHLEKKSCDIGSLLHQIVSARARQFLAYSFALDLSTEATAIAVDPNKINQAVENLLSNAIKFSPANSTITIRGRYSVAGWEISVIDQGKGLTPEQANQVFERFYRADTSNTAKQGLGLGMTIAKAIIEAHGGKIRLSSTPGAGTTVTFTLPDPQNL